MEQVLASGYRPPVNSIVGDGSKPHGGSTFIQVTNTMMSSTFTFLPVVPETISIVRDCNVKKLQDLVHGKKEAAKGHVIQTIDCFF